MARLKNRSVASESLASGHQEELLLGEKELLLGEKELLLGVKEVLLGVKEVLLGVKEVLLGVKEVLLGEKELLLGVKELLLGVKEVLLGVKELLLGVKELLFAEEDVLVDDEHTRLVDHDGIVANEDLLVAQGQVALWRWRCGVPERIALHVSSHAPGGVQSVQVADGPASGQSYGRNQHVPGTFWSHRLVDQELCTRRVLHRAVGTHRVRARRRGDDALTHQEVHRNAVLLPPTVVPVGDAVAAAARIVGVVAVDGWPLASSARVRCATGRLFAELPILTVGV